MKQGSAKSGGSCLDVRLRGDYSHATIRQLNYGESGKSQRKNSLQGLMEPAFQKFLDAVSNRLLVLSALSPTATRIKSMAFLWTRIRKHSFLQMICESIFGMLETKAKRFVRVWVEIDAAAYPSLTPPSNHSCRWPKAIKYGRSIRGYHSIRISSETLQLAHVQFKQRYRPCWRLARASTLRQIL